MKMSKSIYEEILGILLDSFQDPQDEDDDCYMLSRREMIKISKAIEKAQKQEKLLEKLVEKDTPKKIIKETISHYINAEDYYKVDYYKCPSCEKTVLKDRWQDITVHTTNKHCRHCGQKLDWSDNE